MDNLDNSSSTSVQSLIDKIKYSTATRLVMLGVLFLALQIPNLLISSVHSSRERRQHSVVKEVSSKWGDEQVLGGPILNFTGTVQFEEKITNREGNTSVRKQVHSKITRLLPDRLSVESTLEPQTRSRGIYQVLLYSASVKMSGEFTIPEGVFPDQAIAKNTECVLGVSDPKGLRKLEFTLNGKPRKLEPNQNYPSLRHGFKVAVEEFKPGDKVPFTFELVVQGSGDFSVFPLGSQFDMAMTSSWPDPSFSGNLLPYEREVTPKGFSAKWSMMELNRSYPQFWKDTPNYDMQGSSVGVKIVQTANPYQQTQRTMDYSYLLLAIMLLTLLITEKVTRVIIHPLQYLICALGFLMFYVLLLSLSEHMPFLTSYCISSAIVILLCGGYSLGIYRNRKAALGIAAMLLMAYLVIWIILSCVDTALLVGSFVLLLLLAILMFLTRKLNRPETDGELTITNRP